MQRLLCAHCAQYEREAPTSLTAGVQGPLKGHGSSEVLDALSCYLSLIFKHSDTKWNTEKHSRSGGVFFFLGGGGGRRGLLPPPPPPLDPPLHAHF